MQIRKIKFNNSLIVKLMMLLVFFWEPIRNIHSNLEFVIISFIAIYVVLRGKIEAKFVIVIICIGLHGMINILLGNDDIGLFLNQFIALSVCLAASYVLQRTIDIDSILNTYVNISCLISTVAILQQILNLLGFPIPTILAPRGIGTKELGIFMRTTGIYGEPSNFVYVVAPCLYYSICNLKKVGKMKFFIILLSLLLNFTTIGYCGIALALLLYVNSKYSIISLKRLIILVITITAVYLAYYNIEGINTRINELVGNIFTNDLTGINDTSSALILNIRTMFYSLEKTIMFGSGIGSSPITSIELHHTIVLNAEDGCSLAVRLLSELGVPGFVCYLLFLSSYRSTKDDLKLYYLSNTCLVMIGLYMIRQGNYFYNNFIFVNAIYYFIGKRTRKIVLHRQYTKG